MDQCEALICDGVQLLAQKASNDAHYAWLLESSLVQTIQSERGLSDAQRAALLQTPPIDLISQLKTALGAAQRSAGQTATPSSSDLLAAAVQRLAEKAAADPAYAWELESAPTQTIQVTADLSEEHRAALLQTPAEDVLSLLRGSASRPLTPALPKGKPQPPQNERVQQITGDVDVTKRILTADRGNEYSWWANQNPPWSTLTANNPQFQGYYFTQDDNGNVNVQPDQFFGGNRTDSLSAFYYLVDGADRHFAFEGWIWSAIKGQPEGALIWLFGDVTPPLSLGGGYLFDTMAYSPGPSVPATLFFYTTLECDITSQYNEIAAHYYNGITCPTNREAGGLYTLLVCPHGTAPDGHAWGLGDMIAQSAPHSGISLPCPVWLTQDQVALYPGGEAKYVIIRLLNQNQSPNYGESILTYFDEHSPYSATSATYSKFRYIRTISNNENGFGHFLNALVRAHRDGGEDYVYMWGTGGLTDHPAADIFFARTLASRFSHMPVSPRYDTYTQYLVDASSGMKWIPAVVPAPDPGEVTNPASPPQLFGLFNQLSEADPSFVDMRLSGFSVSFVAGLGLWIMLFTRQDLTQGTRAVFARLAVNPWGPWENEVVVFSTADGLFRDITAPGFIHSINLGPPVVDTVDGLDGPQPFPLDSTTTAGFLYFPSIIASLTHGSRHGATTTIVIVWTVSTYMPYYSVVMRSVLRWG